MGVQALLSERDTKLKGVSINGIECDIDINHYYNFRAHHIGPCTLEEYFKQFVNIFGDEDNDVNQITKIMERCLHIPSRHYIITGNNLKQMSFNPVTKKGVINNYYNVFSIFDHNRKESSLDPSASTQPFQEYVDFNPNEPNQNEHIADISEMIQMATSTQ
jgi:hypothetical protein